MDVLDDVTGAIEYNAVGEDRVGILVEPLVDRDDEAPPLLQFDPQARP